MLVAQTAGDAQFWQDVRLATDADKCAEYVDTILDEDEGAPKPTDALSSPPAKRKAGNGDDRQSDAKLAVVLCKTELMVLNFHQSSRT